ncbi:MAG: porin family protein [Rhodospirillales bacterium]|nr:porin family protein [Rhodospirillales bacterium]MDH3791513.1 porin family protein [Rhodospirillales bacterium]MDH3909689.1 porin family protein [Rhodospirillales bacterium]MDH3965770.1 porin family protein [Rhodospirillales bacterium]
MRTLKLPVIAAAFLLLGMQGASAQGMSAQGFYVGLQAGMNIAHDTDIGGLDLDFDVGAAVGIIGGYRINSNFRVDAEVTYRNNDLSDFSGDISSWAFMANGYYDFQTGTNWVPYIGGGIGFANVEIDSGGSDDDNVFAYQAGVGVAYEITPQLAVSLDYRFFGTADPEIFGDKLDYLNSTIMTGLRYTF